MKVTTVVEQAKARNQQQYDDLCIAVEAHSIPNKAALRSCGIPTLTMYGRRLRKHLNANASETLRSMGHNRLLTILYP